MEVFPERYDQADLTTKYGFANCMKRPIVVQAQKILTEFRVKTLEGDYKLGKPGDYLMCGVDGEMYICDADIFERTYDFI